MAGLLVLGIRRYIPAIWRPAYKFIWSLWTVLLCSKPGLKLGLTIDERDPGICDAYRGRIEPIDPAISHSLHCRVYARVDGPRSPISDIETYQHPRGKRIGWWMPAHTGSRRATLRFSTKNSSFLRKFKGSEIIIVTSMIDRQALDSQDDLEGGDCRVIVGWRELKGGYWQRIAGWRLKAPRGRGFGNIP